MYDRFTFEKLLNITDILFSYFPQKISPFKSLLFLGKKKTKQNKTMSVIGSLFFLTSSHHASISRQILDGRNTKTMISRIQTALV